MGCGCDVGSAPEERALSERLRVLAVSARTITVAADRASGCAACSARKGCGAAALAEMARPEVVALVRPEGLAVRPGDEVEVTIAGNAFLAAAGLAYLIPAAALVLAASVAASAGLSDLWSGLAGFGAMALAFLPLAFAERRGPAPLQVLAVHPTGAGR